MMRNGINDERVKLAIEIAVKLGILFIVLYVSYLIVKPFLSIILWSIILAVAFYPVVLWLEKRFRSRKKIVLVMSSTIILALVVPTWSLSGMVIESTQTLVSVVNGEKRMVPPPSEKVKSWPLIGEKSYKLWSSAYKDLPNTLKPFKEKIKKFIMMLINMLKSALGTVAQTIASVIIASFMLISAEKGAAFYSRIMKRLLGERGEEWAGLSALTVRSVAAGVVGVAVIQSSFALVGMIAMGVPMAPLWALIIMFLTIIQMPALIVIGPMIAYVFSYASGAPATIFAVYMLVVGASDGVLKPMLMGRGVDIPMLVILIGAIGGMMLMGMIGLFLGAVILALGYKLFELWMSQTDMVKDASA
jgi:predicted PurR-regulated permease PerM